ncbi:MAG: hypothetical protein V3V13_08925 [Paracoccaceae bacterium]
MKPAIFSTIALLFIAACDQPAAVTTQTSPAQADIGVRAFAGICLATALSFKGAASKSSGFGLGSLRDMGFMQMASTPDNSLALQLTANKECVITTPDRSNVAQLRQDLAAAISKVTGQNIPASFPQGVNINGQSFIIQHDSNGGEAYVMLKK